MDAKKNNANQLKNLKKEKIISVIAGCVTGLINGLFGGGGGMIVVSILTSLLNCKPKSAHATALMIILPLSLVSGLMLRLEVWTLV